MEFKEEYINNLIIDTEYNKIYIVDDLSLTGSTITEDNFVGYIDYDMTCGKSYDEMLGEIIEMFKIKILSTP